MPTRRQLVALLGCGAALLVGAPTASAFTATPAAVKIVREMRAAYRAVKAVRDVRTGAAVYCPSIMEGWTYAPAAGCRARARVVEEDDLAHGRVVRLSGRVTARGLPALLYAAGPGGWFQTASGRSCWHEFAGIPFVAALFVSYPLPHERVTLLHRTKRTIVLQATAPGYRELDDVDARTHLLLRVQEITVTPHKSFVVTDRYTTLARQTAAVSTPLCG